MLNQKNNSSHYDFIIVGQGIAGSALSISLIKQGYNICVIDKPELSNSSKVAAGIWNPVVFKRLTKSWLADDLVPELIRFYSEFENECHEKFIHHRAILKPFSEEQEIVLWQKKALSDNQFLDSAVYQNYVVNQQQTIKHYSKVLHAGNLDMLAFMNACRQYVTLHANYCNQLFDFNKLAVTATDVTYDNVTANKIIFCEGHLISQNPYFKWIPFKPAKGETLTIKCDNLNLENDILNKGVFIMPLGNNTYKVGATYEWTDLSDYPTEKGKLELEQKLNTLIQTPYTIISHDAGVRPSVIDRRPVIGAHPEYNNVLCFNGFGTKAIMLVPYFTKQFINYLKANIAISSEVDLKRFYKK